MTLLPLFKLAVEHANRPQEIDQSVDRFDGLIVAFDDGARKFIEWCFGVGRDGLVKFFVASPRSVAQGVAFLFCHDYTCIKLTA